MTDFDDLVKQVKKTAHHFCSSEGWFIIPNCDQKYGLVSWLAFFLPARWFDPFSLVRIDSPSGRCLLKLTESGEKFHLGWGSNMVDDYALVCWRK